MINMLLAIYRREMFFPRYLGLFCNPFFIARKGLCDAITALSPALQGRLLDVGCGTKPYRSLFKVDDYIGLDIDSKIAQNRGIADVYYDGRAFPFEDLEFDSVLCNQVLEHVFNPDEFIREIQRVLKPGGRLLLTVPFVWDEHEQPFDCARYTSFGLRVLLEKGGFRILQYKKLGTDASTLFQLINAYTFKLVHSLPKPIELATTVTIMAFVNMLGLAAQFFSPTNPDLYLDNVVLAEKIS